MCLAVPGKILSLHDDARGTVDMLGAQREVSIRLTPDAAVGDYVLVHAALPSKSSMPKKQRKPSASSKTLPI